MKLENLRLDERASIALRALYRQYGYRPYKVNTFEEYDLYMRNRSYLASEQILTFPGGNGALMALKPDITLSIVKNTKDEDAPLKVCYCENIYRVPKGEDGFKEIMQTGVECIGRVDDYAMGEVLTLAAKSLEAISESYMLDVSHMGVVSAILAGANLDGAACETLLHMVSEKNLHGLMDACSALGVNEKTREQLAALVTTYGPISKTLSRFEQMELPEGCAAGLKTLRRLSDMLALEGIENVNLDFSVVNDMSYYNGLIFSGFVDGIPTSVLSGGRYDLLMRRMGRANEAIGFAVYLDQLERLGEGEKVSGVDVLILTDEATDPLLAAKAAKEQIGTGRIVRVQRAGGAQPGAETVIDLRETEG